jgi:hypothetical protein
MAGGMCGWPVLLVTGAEGVLGCGGAEVTDSECHSWAHIHRGAHLGVECRMAAAHPACHMAGGPLSGRWV